MNDTAVLLFIVTVMWVRVHGTNQFIPNTQCGLIMKLLGT